MQDHAETMLCLEVIFFLSLLSVIYAYFIYLMTIYVIGFYKNNKVRKSAVDFIVTIIIAAHNEEK